MTPCEQHVILDSVMDEMDRRLITELAKDARQDNLELSRKLGISESTVRRRIRRLQDNSLITFTVVPDVGALGHGVLAIIGLEMDLGSLDQVAQTLSSSPNVHYVAVCTGNHDILFGASFRSHRDLIEFVMNSLGKMPGIRKSETFVILDVRKNEVGWLQRLEQVDFLK